MAQSAPPTVCERYHEATKYTPESVRGHRGLDFSSQPAPFKSWHQARIKKLETGADTPPPAGPLDASRLGCLLYHTYGVTLVREFPGMSMHYRAAPSAGGLYPSELYVATREVPGVPDGIHAYHARKHTLIACWEGDFWPDMAACTFAHPATASARAVLIGTGIFQRSAWRYGDRAYRRVLLDTGHVFGNAVLAAGAMGQRVVPIPDFDDDGLNGLLLLDPGSEGTLLLAAVLDASTAVPAVPPHRASGAPRDDEEESWIRTVHDAGRMAQPQEPGDTESPQGVPAPVGDPIPLCADGLAGGAPALEAIRKRRSTRVFAPMPMSLDTAGRILAHAYPQSPSAEPEAWLLPDVLDTYVVVAGLTDVSPGVYRYDRHTHALHPIRVGNPRKALHRCCLWQELGRDCAFAVIHTIDLSAAAARYGDRVYRTCHLEAGLIGERLNLAALRLDQGASGIGGFFDDFVTELLTLGPNHAVAYITVIGSPA